MARRAGQDLSAAQHGPQRSALARCRKLSQLGLFPKATEVDELLAAIPIDRSCIRR